MKIENIIKCDCGDLSHAIQFAYFEEDRAECHLMYISTILNNKHNFFKRLWYGLRYILLGDVCKYGISQEAVVEKEEVRRLRNICNSFLEEPNE